MARKQMDIIKRAISILDSVDYAHYSDKRAAGYLEYVSGTWKDERKLIHPILFRKFLEQVLGFKLGESVGTQEAVPESGDIPDYAPVDTRTHPFIFDCKGMDTENLSKWYGQIRRYAEAQGVRYGVLTNMRDTDVYTPESGEEIEVFNFSFVQLYKDYKEDLPDILEKENTKRFLRFVERFKFVLLTLDEKFRRVAEAKSWTGKETLNIDLLIGRLRHIVECIHEDTIMSKDVLTLLMDTDPERVKTIAQEIESIASEIERGREPVEASVETFEAIMKAPAKSTMQKAVDIFFYRVAYFTMTRLLLARTWEDIGFIDQSLYNGGLAKLYENFNNELHRVLRYAFGLAADRYKWLFNIDNNYTWYEPSIDSLIEVLYELSNFNLGKLNQDVLGTIYEEYIDKVNKKQKGQYYTPREIIELIWNRVGFTNPKAFFWHIKGERRPKFIFDPATGSGGFLVEAARRIREESGINRSDFRDLNDIRFAIVSYIFGSEISIFPYYITEVNLLIQLTPVVKRMIELKKGFKESQTLGVVPVDALSLYNPQSMSFVEQESELEQIQDLLPLERQKRAIFQKIRSRFDGKFSYCCANPPYIGEKGNKELFRDTLKRFPYFKEFYQGKMDYLYFFIILGLSKLRNPGERAPGGKLGFITTAYWPTADGASRLRKYILENTKIKEMIFFEDVKIFEYAKGQHNMVFILEKCSGKGRKNEREDSRIKVVRILTEHKEVPGNTIRNKLKFLTDHIKHHVDKDDWQDEYVRIFWSGIKQGQLPDDGGSWHDALVPVAQVAYSDKVMRLKKAFDIYQGIVPNPDRITRSNIKVIPPEEAVRMNEGVFVLTEAELNALGLSENERALVKQSYRNSDISRYVVDIPEEKNIFLLYITKHENIEEYPDIKNHLCRYRSILERRREVERGRIPWYSLHWPRKVRLFETPKIVCSNWGNDWQPFAIQEAGFYERRDITLLLPKRGVKESPLYFLGLLNSKLLINWAQDRLKQRGYMRQKLQEQIPIRRIDFDNPQEVRSHNRVVTNVQAIREKMAGLAHYSKHFKAGRLTRLKLTDSLPDVDPESIIEALSAEKRFSLRTHPNFEIILPRDFVGTKFVLKKVGKVDLALEGPELKLSGKERKTVLLRGPEELLELVSLILENHRNESWNHLKELPFVPETVKDYEGIKQDIIRKVTTLRDEINKLQRSIDTAVFKLYGVPEGQVLR